MKLSNMKSDEICLAGLGISCALLSVAIVCMIAVGVSEEIREWERWDRCGCQLECED